MKESGSISISVLQDTFKISYTRASRLIDALQRNGELPVIAEETHVEINTVPVEEMLNHTEENKLDEDVAKVYESISITVQENLEK